MISIPPPNVPLAMKETRRPRSNTLSSTVLLILCIVCIVAGIFWLQWSSQRALTNGYPHPTVHIETPTSTALKLQSSTRFVAVATGRDLTYSWSFQDLPTSQSTSTTTTTTNTAPSDGGHAQGTSVSYAYQNMGKHMITVIVTDAIGQTSQATLNVQVTPPAPQATFTYQDNSAYGYYSIAVDASASTANPITSIQQYLWDFGDGTPVTSNYYATDFHTYANPGTYTIKLVVIDQLGQESQPYTRTITIAASTAF